MIAIVSMLYPTAYELISGKGAILVLEFCSEADLTPSVPVRVGRVDSYAPGPSGVPQPFTVCWLILTKTWLTFRI